MALQIHVCYVWISLFFENNCVDFLQFSKSVGKTLNFHVKSLIQKKLLEVSLLGSSNLLRRIHMGTIVASATFTFVSKYWPQWHGPVELSHDPHIVNIFNTHCIQIHFHVQFQEDLRIKENVQWVATWASKTESISQIHRKISIQKLPV